MVSNSDWNKTFICSIERFLLHVPKHSLPMFPTQSILLCVLLQSLPAYLQAPHSNVPFPSWHFGLLGMPSLWQSHSQMNWRIISTSSVKPRGLILMVSEFLFGHLFEVMLISNWTLKEKTRLSFKLTTKQFKSTKKYFKKLISFILKLQTRLLTWNISIFLFFRKCLHNLPHLQWKYWSIFFHFPLFHSPHFCSKIYNLLLLLLAICCFPKLLLRKGTKAKTNYT